MNTLYEETISTKKQCIRQEHNCLAIYTRTRWAKYAIVTQAATRECHKSLPNTHISKRRTYYFVCLLAGPYLFPAFPATESPVPPIYSVALKSTRTLTPNVLSVRRQSNRPPPRTPTIVTNAAGDVSREGISVLTAAASQRNSALSTIKTAFLLETATRNRETQSGPGKARRHLGPSHRVYSTAAHSARGRVNPTYCASRLWLRRVSLTQKRPIASHNNYQRTTSN